MKQIIIGPTFYAAGKALQNNNDLLVIGYNNSIGDEWCYSYRKINPKTYKPKSEITAKLLSELNKLNLNTPNQNALAFSVLLYEYLKEIPQKFKLWTEIESIKNIDDGYELEIFNVSGHEKLRCQKLIDNTPAAYSYPSFGKKNVKSKKLNMIIHNCGSLDMKIPKIIENLTIRAGRNIRELIVEYTVNPELEMIDARQQLLEYWVKRPSEMENWKIAAFGAEFDYDVECNSYEIKSNWEYLNPLAFNSPLEAFDAGLTGDL